MHDNRQGGGSDDTATDDVHIGRLFREPERSGESRLPPRRVRMSKLGLFVRTRWSWVVRVKRRCAYAYESRARAYHAGMDEDEGCVKTRCTELRFMWCLTVEEVRMVWREEEEGEREDA